MQSPCKQQAILFHQSVRGEVYEVDDAALEGLDKLEHYPGWYLRREEPIRVKHSTDESTRVLNCHTYLLPGFKRELLELEMLECFEESHGKMYSVNYEHEVGIDYIRKAVSED